MTCKHKDCIYRQGVAGSSEENCGYMLITGNKRNSPADNCDKYRSRKSRVKGWQRTNEAGKKKKSRPTAGTVERRK